jgi:hypothetical protein
MRVEWDGRLFECAACGHQTRLTSSTVLEGTRKPFKLWFRAVFEISSRKNGILAKELQRILGFGSYETAWTWLHNIRGSLKRPGREPFGEDVEIDEAFVGSKCLGKSMVLVATETDGRVRLAHALTNDPETLTAFADANLAADAAVTSAGHADYNATSLGEARTRTDRADKCQARRLRHAPARALVGADVEALADGHAPRCNQGAPPASLPLLVRVPLEPPQNKGRRPHLGAHNRDAGLTSRPHNVRDSRRREALASVYARRIGAAGWKGTGMVRICLAYSEQFDGVAVRYYTRCR